MQDPTQPTFDDMNPQQLAIEALREVAQSTLIGDGGIFLEFSSMDYAGVAVFVALTEAGEIETVERHESFTGLQQVVWQGKRLRDHNRPSVFREMRLPRFGNQKG